MVIGDACRATPGQEFLRFFAPHLTVPSSSRATWHLVLDNYANPQEPEVKSPG